MSESGRKLSEERRGLSDATAAVLTAIDQVADWEDLLSRLSVSGWSLGENHRGVELLTVIDGQVTQVFVEIGVGVTVRRWGGELGDCLPAQKIQWETSISIYPKYEAGDPIFDDLRTCGLTSGMSLQATAEILTEIARFLLPVFE